MFQACTRKKYEKNDLIGQIMEKNEISIQVLFQFHIKTWWIACIYVLQGVHTQKNGNNNVRSIYSKKICKKSPYRSNNGKKWNKHPIIISIPHKNMMNSLYICTTRLFIHKNMEIIMF